MTTKQPAAGSTVAPGQAEVDSLQRGLEILRSFRPGEKSLRLAEIVARTNMPRLTALKLLNTLTAHRFLRHLPELDRYEPDVSCSVLGHALRASLPILRVSGPIMQALSDKLEVDVFLAVRERMDMMVLEYCGARSEATQYSVGSLVPVAQTAAGRAWLFAQRPAVQGDFIERIRVEADEREVNAIPAIYRSFQDLAERGYCFSAGDWMGDRHSIATPLILSGGRKVLALAALAGKPWSKETFLRDTVAPALMDAAARIKAEMQDKEA
jgi:DNA-binding IclR family transcriptional regulator